VNGLLWYLSGIGSGMAGVWAAVVLIDRHRQRCIRALFGEVRKLTTDQRARVRQGRLP
jgi:hypothetical protein